MPVDRIVVLRSLILSSITHFPLSLSTSKEIIKITRKFYLEKRQKITKQILFKDIKHGWLLKDACPDMREFEYEDY